jgi:hypothetical protein
MDEMYLADVYVIFHSTAGNYTFFSVVDRMFTKTDQIPGHKINLNKHKKLKKFPVS